MKTKTNTSQQIATMQALSQASAAWLAGRSPRTLRDSAAPREPSGGYDARALVEWLLAEASAGETMLATGAESESLERYRAAKAKIAELDCAERMGQVIAVEELNMWLGRACGILRNASIKIGKQFGPIAQQIHNDAIGEFDRIRQEEYERLKAKEQAALAAGEAIHDRK
ncbi:MAG: hypothetical protein K8T25_01980 [Planctomycetia bacterium]|nr:hypothetical protein [Planctomycetia bacterium]